MNPPSPLCPNRIRTVERPFAWIPCRLLINGLFKNMSDPAKLLYIFLCLAADKQGMSFYGDNRILSFFQFSNNILHSARAELIQNDLIAYNGRLYQVLSMPMAKPPPITRAPRTTEPERFYDILAKLADNHH
jgi:hypothetical protein